MSEIQNYSEAVQIIKSAILQSQYDAAKPSTKSSSCSTMASVSTYH